MSFKTGSLAQHRDWNLFLRKQRGAAEIALPFSVAGSGQVWYSETSPPDVFAQNASLIGLTQPVFLGRSSAFTIVYDQAGNGVWRSADGVTFVKVPGSDGALGGGAFSTVLRSAVVGSVWVVCIASNIYRSADDGATWALVYDGASGGGNATSVCHTGSKFLATRSHASQIILVSADGVTWNAQPAPTYLATFGAPAAWQCCAFFKGKFYTCGDTSGAVPSSNTTVCWESTDDGLTLTGVVYHSSIGYNQFAQSSTALMLKRTASRQYYLNSGAGFDPTRKNLPFPLLYGDTYTYFSNHNGVFFGTTQAGETCFSLDDGLTFETSGYANPALTGTPYITCF